MDEPIKVLDQSEKPRLPASLQAISDGIFERLAGPANMRLAVDAVNTFTRECLKGIPVRGRFTGYERWYGSFFEAILPARKLTDPPWERGLLLWQETEAYLGELLTRHLITTRQLPREQWYKRQHDLRYDKRYPQWEESWQYTCFARQVLISLIDQIASRGQTG